MIKHSEVYNEVCKVLPKGKISHWCSDLYFKRTAETKAIVNEYEFKQNVTTFIDNIDHEVWYEVPFGYPNGMQNPTE